MDSTKMVQNGTKKVKKQQKLPTKKNNVLKSDSEYLELNQLVATYDWTKFDKFESIPISTRTKNGLRKNGYKQPTDIQKQSIGYSLAGNDVLGAAKTGSGKTIAFLVPMLECLYKNQWTAWDGLGALIISPTRELAYQIFEVLNKIGGQHDFSVGLIIGGKDLKFESKRMDRCNIIVCTPGRLLQHMDENSLFTCDNLKMLILDEADRILDLGFAKTMNAIIANLPSERQTLLFSATQTKSVKDLARLSLKNPIYISSHENEKYSTPKKLTQSYMVCNLEDKINLLWSFLKQHTKFKIIVFMSSCKQVKFVYELFCKLRPGIPLLALYGSLHQMKRMSIYDKFCQSNRTVLFATDIASRGLDFPGVNWVVQMDCPEDVNTYIHRVGRTARFEDGGESLLVLLPTEETMVELLKEKKVPIDRIMVNPKKLTNIQRKCEAYLARDVSLKESAQRAFKSYLKNTFYMKNKQIFQLDKLNLDQFAHSLGLVITPRVRFIERKLAMDNEKVEEKFKCESDDNVHESIDKKEPNVRGPISSINLTLDNDDDDKDDDLFQVKRVWRFDQTTDSTNDDLNLSVAEPTNKKSTKSISKAAVAKRLLKKNIKLNTKIVFDDDGTTQVFNGGVMQSSNIQARQLDNAKSGIDIELSKKIMEEEDKVDKQMYRNLLKEKNREKKKKLKAQRDSKNSNVELNMSGDEDDSGKLTDFFIENLPDPDRIYGKLEEVDENESDDDKQESSMMIMTENNRTSTKRKYNESDDDSDESEMETMNDEPTSDLENMALRLLSR